MKAAGRRGAASMVLMAATLGLSACRDNGLRPEMNRPLDQAVNAETAGYPAYEASPDNRPVSLEGRSYLGSATVERIPEHMLEEVGTAEGVTLYAVRGGDAPHARLYAPTGPGEWRPYLRLN